MSRKTRLFNMKCWTERTHDYQVVCTLVGQSYQEALDMYLKLRERAPDILPRWNPPTTRIDMHPIDQIGSKLVETVRGINPHTQSKSDI